jgi:hypothetical protein
VEEPPRGRAGSGLLHTSLPLPLLQPHSLSRCTWATPLHGYAVCPNPHGPFPPRARAQAEARFGHARSARSAFRAAARRAPAGQRWKLWVCAAHAELGLGAAPAARMLLRRALREAPAARRACVRLACARLEELAGDAAAARVVLRRARAEAPHEWRLGLEAVLLEVRAGRRGAARRAACDALAATPGAGRLWAARVRVAGSEAEGVRMLAEACLAVPRSGEVPFPPAIPAAPPAAPRESAPRRVAAAGVELPRDPGVPSTRPLHSHLYRAAATVANR